MRRRPGRRIPRLRMLAVFLALALPVSAFYWFHAAGLRKFLPSRALTEEDAIDLQLPFTVPCAVSSEDASIVYTAIRARDRGTLARLFAEKRMISARRGVPVKISFFGNVAMLASKNDSSGEDVCFIPSGIVAVIRQHTHS